MLVHLIRRSCSLRLGFIANPVIRANSTDSAAMGEFTETCSEGYKYLYQKDLLKNKVAFITGGGSGIGFTIAEIFMRHGCKVVIASRRFDRVQRSAQELERGTGGTCLPLALDVRKPADILKSFDTALDKFGKIDILVNNAAGNFLSPAASLSFNAYKTVLEIDTMGTFNCSKTVYEKYMRDHGGVILNISAILWQVGAPLQAHAGSAKAAIDALTVQLAVEWGPSKVRVVGVAPGPIGDTEGMRRLSAGIPGDVIASTVPIGRLGSRLDIAEGALYLVSDAASYVTGETLVVDGASRYGSGMFSHGSKL